MTNSFDNVITQVKKEDLENGKLQPLQDVHNTMPPLGAQDGRQEASRHLEDNWPWTRVDTRRTPRPSRTLLISPRRQIRFISVCLRI
uniref:Uncharacterized protein n=1 Tax=Plectus sambesii TaxID=2011161 RepID=A0A914VXW0_9BILA